MAVLFGRKWRVTIGQGATAKTTGDGLRTLDALVVDALRVELKCTASLAVEPNTAEIKITNLSAPSRSKISVKGVPILVEAGYEGTFGIIFSGEVRTSSHVRTGADWVTTITAGDAEKNYAFAPLEKSYGAQTPVATVASDAAKALSANLGNIADFTLAASGQSFKRGYVAHGAAKNALDAATKKIGWQWSILRGALYFFDPRKKLQAQNIVELSSDSGLVGIPELVAADDEKKPAKLKAQALMNANIWPGGFVSVKSEDSRKSGVFKVTKVDFTGDSHGPQWLASFEAVQAKDEVL